MVVVAAPTPGATTTNQFMVSLSQTLLQFDVPSLVGLCVIDHFLHNVSGRQSLESENVAMCHYPSTDGHFQGQRAIVRVHTHGSGLSVDAGDRTISLAPL